MASIDNVDDCTLKKDIHLALDDFSGVLSLTSCRFRLFSDMNNDSLVNDVDVDVWLRRSSPIVGRQRSLPEASAAAAADTGQSDLQGVFPTSVSNGTVHRSTDLHRHSDPAVTATTVVTRGRDSRRNAFQKMLSNNLRKTAFVLRSKWTAQSTQQVHLRCIVYLLSGGRLAFTVKVGLMIECLDI